MVRPVNSSLDFRGDWGGRNEGGSDRCANNLFTLRRIRFRRLSVYMYINMNVGGGAPTTTIFHWIVFYRWRTILFVTILRTVMV